MNALLVHIAFVGSVWFISQTTSGPSESNSASIIVSVDRTQLASAVCSQCTKVDAPVSFDGMAVLSHHQSNITRTIGIGIYRTAALATEALGTQLLSRAGFIRTREGQRLDLSRGFIGRNVLYVRKSNVVVACYYKSSPGSTMIMDEANRILQALENPDVVKLGDEPDTLTVVLGERYRLSDMVWERRQTFEKVSPNSYVFEVSVDAPRDILFPPSALKPVRIDEHKYLITARRNSDENPIILRFARESGEVTVLEIKASELNQITQRMTRQEMEARKMRAAASQPEEVDENTR